MVSSPGMKGNPARASRRLHSPGVGISCMPLDDAGRRGEAFNGSNSLLEPPAEFGSPILELPVDAEIVGPVLCDIGIELGLPTDGDEVGLPVSRMASACRASRMMPTAIDAMPTSL